MSNLIKREIKKGVELAKEDTAAIANLGSQAARSGAYLFPFLGVAYLASHPRLVENLKPIIVKSITMSVATLAVLFTFTYFPQVAVLAVISGPLAFIAAVPLVLAESYAVILFLHRTFLTPAISEKIFDAVLLQKGHDDLVAKGRALDKKGGSVSLGKSLLRPVTSKFSAQGLVRYLVTLPLNFIPGVGTAIFLLLNGRKAGPAAHARYFQLKEWDKQTRNKFVEERSAAYTSFGAASLLLGLIPVVGPAFAFTSAAGAALWAADMEKNSAGGSKGKGSNEGEVEGRQVHIGKVEL
ncbi:hypothetical protein JCM8547_008790 [Rhodosporidiobolus lusitaniae]